MTDPKPYDEQTAPLTKRERLTAWLNGDVKRKQTIGPYAILALGVLAGFWFTARTSSAASQGQVDASARTACYGRIDSRDQLRGVFIALYSRLEVTFPEAPLIADLRADLDDQYPELDPASCEVAPYQPVPVVG